MGAPLVFKKQLTFSIIVLTVVSSLFLATSCSPYLTLNVDNQTAQTIEMYVNNTQYFDVPPNTTTEAHTDSIDPKKFLVEAVNQQGQLIYSMTFDHSQLVITREGFLSVKYTLFVKVTTPK